MIEKHDALDLICIIEGLFRYLNNINRRGFVNEVSYYESFINHISNHLSSLGYEEKTLGNSELTYTM